MAAKLQQVQNRAKHGAFQITMLVFAYFLSSQYFLQLLIVWVGDEKIVHSALFESAVQTGVVMGKY